MAVRYLSEALIPIREGYSMWRFNTVILLLCSLGCGGSPDRGEAETAADPSARDVDEELRALEGVWGQVLTVFEGKETKVNPKSRTLTFEATEVVDYDLNAPKSTRRMTFAIDVTRHPKSMDIFLSGITEPAKRSYELEGDTLRLAGTVSNDNYPKEFTGTGDGQILLVFQRQK